MSLPGPGAVDLLKIDGSTGEGGGQIVRLALFLSLIKGTPVELFNIRRGRKNPGLKRQHLHVIEALEAITGSRCQGARLGSTTIRFFPGPIKGGRVRIDFGTAGSIPLFLQTLLPVVLFASNPVELTVIGGTDVPMGPTMEFIRHLYMPFLAPLASRLEVKVIRRGFYPVGGGEVRLVCHPKKARHAFSWEEFLDYIRVFGPIEPGLWDTPGPGVVSVASSSLKERRVAHRQAQRAMGLLEERLSEAPSIEIVYQPSASPGSAITLWFNDPHRTLGADALGARGKSAERVAQEAAERLLDEYTSGAEVDRHLADHLVPWVGLRGGQMKVSRVTLHLETSLWLYNLMVPERPVRLEGEILKGPC